MCLPQSNSVLRSATDYGDSSPYIEDLEADKGSIPCLFLDRPMKKEDRDTKWDSNKLDINDLMNINNGQVTASYDMDYSHQSRNGLSELSVTRRNHKDKQEPIDDDDPGKMMLYFHANADDLGMCYYQLDCLKERLGVRILAMEYPGYGLHGYESKDTERLQQDALTVYDFVN